MNEEIKHIAQVIAEKFKPRRVVLFGSKASGNETANSDIDLCVIEDHVSDKSEEIIKIRRTIGPLSLPMDLLVFGEEEFNRRKGIWGTVQFEIEKKGVVLYDRTK